MREGKIIAVANPKMPGYMNDICTQKDALGDRSRMWQKEVCELSDSYTIPHTLLSGREGHGLGLGAQKRDATNPLGQASHLACPESHPTHPEGVGLEHCNLTVWVR